MQCDLAQEKFSDYIEETLTPAMRHVLEQHLAECDPCTGDIVRLRVVYAMLGEEQPLLETPPGFRASVLNAIREQPAQRSAWQRLQGLFAPAQPGRFSLAFGSAAALTLVVLGGIWLNRHGVVAQPPVNNPQASFAPWAAVPVSVQNSTGILQGVHSYQSADGNTYHVFGLHLPTGMDTTQASVNVLQGGDAISDASLLGDAVKAPTAWSGSVERNTSVQVPVAITANVPDNTSMMTLVTWSDSAGSHRELSILPVSKWSGGQPITVGEPLYQALETLAVQYQQPIIVNDGAVSLVNSPVTQSPPASAGSINEALANVAIPDQLSFQRQSDGIYVIDSQ